jgi:NAD(P)H-hydrate epimerase
VGVVVRGLLERATVPLVLDADALTVLGPGSAELAGRDERPVVVTPHPGEMASLTGMTTDAVQTDRIGAAVNLASARHLYVVLKGHRTIVATPDGRAFINITGNPGMATGGTGDVLAGMIAAWLAQLRDVESACRLAVYLHGLAGDLAAEKAGQVGMTAGDLTAALGDALTRLLDRTSQVV